MSVRLRERKPSKMEVQTKAYDLAAYTIAAAGNEKVVPKRYRWSIGEKIIDAALEITGHVDIANSMMLTNPDEAKLRHLEQRCAIANTFKLLTMVNTARRLSGFDEQRHMFWVGLVKEEQELLRGWMDSDRKRLKVI